MAFTQINKTRGAERSSNSVTASCPNGQVIISMTEDIFSQLGSPRFVDLFVGEGADAGSVLVSPALEASKNGYSVWSSPKAPNLHKLGISASRLSVSKSFKTTEAAFEVVPEGLVVTIPAAQASAPRFVINRRQEAAA